MQGVDFNRLYTFGERYVGALGKDLVHHAYLRASDALNRSGKTTDNPTGYVHMTMKTELRRGSSFWKQHGTQFFNGNTETESNEKLNIVCDLFDEFHKEQPIQARTFTEMIEYGNLSKLHRAVGKRYKTLVKIRKFVRSEIIKRYESRNSD